MVGHIVVDIAERKVSGKYYYQIRLSRDEEYILEQFTKELSLDYGGSRFPRKKEIVFAVKVRLKEENMPKEGLESMSLNIEED